MLIPCSWFFLNWLAVATFASGNGSSAFVSFAVFAVPYLTLVYFVIAAIIVGIVAAIWPARRAARLNVLEALQYE